MCDKHKFILKPPILVVSAKEEIVKIQITSNKLYNIDSQLVHLLFWMKSGHAFWVVCIPT